MSKTRFSSKDRAESEVRESPSRPAEGTAGVVLALQQRVGNAAVSRALRPSPRRTLARFVGKEHEALGNTTGASIDLGNGIVLTWGEIVALAGDEYGSLDDLMADTKDETGKARLRAALEHDEIPGTLAATLPAPTATQRSDHESKYIQLAMRNVEHFPDGGAAINAWANAHAAAVELAVQAGLSQDPDGMNMAYANEAFGEHFLTDCYSGGHIRTPRTQIVEFYTQTFGPRVAGPLVDAVRNRLIEALVAEASPQTRWPDSIVRGHIRDQVNPGIDAAIANLGGLAKLGEFIGLGVGGAISGTMHDQEGTTGVQVASDDHPETWTAYGDGDLDKSPVSRQQATMAIAEAKAQVDEAFVLGESEAATRDTAIAVHDPPAVVHFGFDSSTLTAEGLGSADIAAAYMAYHPETIVHIVGHTDPIGSDSYNHDLGQRRADAMATALRDRGVEAGRVQTESLGEGSLLTHEPKQYSRNRRAEIAWGTGPAPSGQSSGSSAPDPQQLATQRAMEKAQQRADTGLVVRFVPRPVEERAQANVPGGNADLPDWHWGSLNPTFRGAVDAYIRAEVGTKLEEQLDKVPQLDPPPGDIVVHPRDHAKAIVRTLLANPTQELGELTGEPAGP
jgi:outer membrane protein OmpA-like peptidoglycan-associated protein